MRTNRTTRAKRLREAIVKGPSIGAHPFTTLTKAQRDEIQELYKIWVNTWILGELDSLIPELRSKES